eukprot:CAMPEP_0172316964 /NCGR_PEP_ID=MMETSP1058-20130122/30144_1 /TAXON_ID=83371 /ORGANISM="Detonula confervacea, Strain CCMP 353" /LENGTH=43 /DNA_ID= /DNA_START= /DNA_END= /DNA_ORIENTATION=
MTRTAFRIASVNNNNSVSITAIKAIRGLAWKIIILNPAAAAIT